MSSHEEEEIARVIGGALAPVTEALLDSADFDDQQLAAVQAALVAASIAGYKVGVGETLGQVREQLAEHGIDFQPTVEESSESLAREAEVKGMEPNEVRTGPGNPTEVASAWLGMLAGRQLEDAWPLTHIDFRREMIAAVIDSGRVPGLSRWPSREPVDDLSGSEPAGHPGWPAFAEAQLEAFGRGLLANVDWASWGWLSSPEPFTPGEELLRLVDTGSPHDGQATDLAEGAAFRSYTFLMRYAPDDGWLVAGMPTGIQR